MAFDRVTLLGLAAIISAMAWTHSPWWLAAFGLIAARVGYDRWARHGSFGHIASPRDGGKLPLADATMARHPRYVIGEFLDACCEARPGALMLAHSQTDMIIGQCARECRRIGQLEPPMVQVLHALQPFCANCALPYSPALLRQKWRDSTATGGIEVAEGPLPDEAGHCPRCGSRHVMLVFDP